VHVSRAAYRRPAPGERRQRLHITLRYPVPAVERARIAQTLTDKVSQENTTWASTYPGIPLFAVDESDFSLGLEDGDLAELSGPGALHSFQGLLVSRADFIDNDGGRSRHRLELATHIVKSEVRDLKIELRTFGTSIQAWSRSTSFR
jgi:hypothetical protein